MGALEGDLAQRMLCCMYYIDLYVDETDLGRTAEAQCAEQYLAVLTKMTTETCFAEQAHRVVS